MLSKSRVGFYWLKQSLWKSKFKEATHSSEKEKNNKEINEKWDQVALYWKVSFFFNDWKIIFEAAAYLSEEETNNKEIKWKRVSSGT